MLSIYEFSHLPDAIRNLEKKNLTLDEQLQIFNIAKEKLSGYSLEKIKASLSHNTDFIRFTNSLDLNYRLKIKYAPLCSIDVERSFSCYKDILSNKRESLTQANIEKLNVIRFNTFI